MTGDVPIVKNKDLVANRIPGPRATWEQTARFALTFDGYAAFGSVERLAELQTQARSGSLSELRGRLFFLQRYWRNQMEAPDAAGLDEIRDVLAQIRQRVELANTLLR